MSVHLLDFCLFRVIAYLFWQIIRGRRTMAKLLREQIVNVSLTFSFILFKIWLSC